VDGLAERRECGLEVQTSQVLCEGRREKGRNGDFQDVEKEIKA
jgi:hypothetical protein